MLPPHRCVFVAAVAVVVLLSSTGRTSPRELSWDCSGEAITLRIAERTIRVPRDPRSNCRELKRSEYYLHEVPETALTAVVAVRDAAGDEVYVSTDGESLIVHHRHVTPAEPILPYREIKRFRLQRTTSNKAMQRTAGRSDA